MLTPSTPTQARLNNIKISATTVVDTLELLANASNLPFLKPITLTARSLLNLVQSVNNNKCTEMMEQVYEVLHGIIRLHVQSETGQLSPNLLKHIAEFTETLYKVHTFVEAQQEKNKFKQILRRGEMNALQRGCTSELQQALSTFKLQGVGLLIGARQTHEYENQVHQEVLHLIDSQFNEESSDGVSTTNQVFSANHNSSNSLSMLPSEPKIFHGRESEVSDILKAFTQGTPRVAILGPGGMGKTTLAKVILHCEDIAIRYIDHRFFVSCESALTKVELTILIGAHLGLKGSKDLTQALIQHFSRGPPCLLVLDNLETLWEQAQFQGAIEEFLSLLAEVEHLALIVTMRGGERPAKVQWTRPFLPPLMPLVQHAARQTFEAIADDVHNAEDVNKVLLLTGNVPLAIDLVSHLVASDGCINVLSRWEEEATAMISQGHDRRSNLDLSISLSLTSPRMKAVPHSRDLLGLLSMLPDGLSDLELQQSKLPIDNILTCKAALIRTSLAYQDKQKRLRVLVPIQEYMQQYYPPTATLIKPLLSHFQELLKTCNETSESQEIISRILPNFANIQSLLSSGPKEDNSDVMKTVEYTLILASLGRVTAGGNVFLMNQIPGLISRLHSPTLELQWLTFSLDSYFYQPLPNPEAIISQGLADISACNNQLVQVNFLQSVLSFYLQQENGMTNAQKFGQQALKFSAGNIKCQSSTTRHLALIHHNLGDHIMAIVHARQSRKLAQLAGNPMLEARALHIEINCLQAIGNYALGISLCQTAHNLLELCMSDGLPSQAIMNSQAEILTSKSEYREARLIYTQLLAKSPLTLSPYHHILNLLNILFIDINTDVSGNTVLQEINILQGILNKLEQYKNWDKWFISMCAEFQLREGDFLPAETGFQRCLNLSWGSDGENVTFCLQALADGYRWGAKVRLTWATLLLVNSLKTKQKVSIHKGLQFMSHFFLCLGDQHTAHSLLTLALEGFTDMDIHQSKAECMLHLGEISEQRGDFSRALQLWEQAKPLFKRSSQTRQLALVDEKISQIQPHLQADQQKLVLLSELHPPSGLAQTQMIKM